MCVSCVLGQIWVCQAIDTTDAERSTSVKLVLQEYERQEQEKGCLVRNDPACDGLERWKGWGFWGGGKNRPQAVGQQRHCLQNGQSE